MDLNGNLYITGYFDSPLLIFGSTTLTNASQGQGDIFVVKYNASGNVLWAKSAGGWYIDVGNGIAVDANGSSYITGMFNSPSITFGNTVLTDSSGYFCGGGQGCSDIFLVKYDSTGNVLWAQRAGGIDHDGGTGINLDANGIILNHEVFILTSLKYFHESPIP